MAALKGLMDGGLSFAEMTEQLAELLPGECREKRVCFLGNGGPCLNMAVVLALSAGVFERHQPPASVPKAGDKLIWDCH